MCIAPKQPAGSPSDGRPCKYFAISICYKASGRLAGDLLCSGPDGMTRMTHRATALLLLALYAGGCTGTPMPIPPSLNPERLSVTEDVDLCPEPELTCSVFAGDEGATEPGALIMAHHIYPMMPFEEALFIEESDPLGGFEGVLEGPVDGGPIRVIAHGQAGSITRDFTIDESVEPMIGAPSCVDFATPETVDLGAVAIGETATATVAIHNDCDDAVEIIEAYVATLTGSETFGSLVQNHRIEPHSSTGLLVAFWPTTVEDDHLGALMVHVFAIEDEMLLSAAVRGRAER